MQLPVNCPYRSKATNYQRDGPQAYDNQGSAPNYYPNSFSGPEQKSHYAITTFNVSGAVAKYENQIKMFFLKLELKIYTFYLNFQVRFK